MTAIRLDRVERRYGDRDAIRELSFELPNGATLAVLGPNGAGKTTLLRLLCGLLRPHGGSISVLGCDLRREAFAIRGRVGVLTHDPLLYRALSVRENLHHQARLLGTPAQRADQLIARVGLEGRADEPVWNLSRGTVQRAAAARAMLCEPELLLLDEPWANLDPTGVALVEPLLSGVPTKVITGHDPRAMLERSDFALGLKASRMTFMTASGDVSEPMLEELYA